MIHEITTAKKILELGLDAYEASTAVEPEYLKRVMKIEDAPELAANYRHFLIFHLHELSELIFKCLLTPLNVPGDLYIPNATTDEVRDFIIEYREARRSQMSAKSEQSRFATIKTNYHSGLVAMGEYICCFAFFVNAVYDAVLHDLHRGAPSIDHYDQAVFQTATLLENNPNLFDSSTDFLVFARTLLKQFYCLWDEIDHDYVSMTNIWFSTPKSRLLRAKAYMANLPMVLSEDKGAQLQHALSFGDLPYGQMFIATVKWGGLTPDSLAEYAKADVHGLGTASIPDQSPIMHEAMSYKRGTIPWGAYVEIDLFPFTGVRLFEFPNGIVHAVWFNNAGKFFVVSNEYVPNQAGFYFFRAVFDTHLDASNPEYLTQTYQIPESKVLAQLIYLMTACVVRDFWVIEERDTVLGAPRIGRLPGKLSKLGPIVIYLPRVKYNRQSNTASLSEFDYANRIAHFVAGFYRKLPEGHEASVAQREWALAHGIVIPSHQTYVRGHERGGVSEDRARIYRSRSALQSLTTIAAQSFSQQIDIRISPTAFERRCGRYIEAHGYTITKYAVANTKDRGIDIHAYKEVNGRVSRLIAQCKRYAKNVGSPELREFLGSHIIAQLMSTSIDEKWLFALHGFTADCVEQAKLSDVRLICASEMSTAP